MSPSKKPNQKPYQKPKQPAPALGQSHTKPWVRVVIVLIAVVLGLGSVVAIFINNDDSSDVSTSGSSTTQATAPATAPAAASVAGKPCVAMVDPLPAGAPPVDVAVGPPPTELVIKDLKVGTGATVEASSTVTVDYVGVACSSGKIFDTSYGKTPATFPLGNVIPGWQQGLAGMKVGGSRLLGVPPALAYQSQGYPPDIAPDETLWFVVDVKDATATTTPST